MADKIDIPSPQPSGAPLPPGSAPAIPIPVPGSTEGIKTMQDSTALVLEQTFAKSHQVGLAQADRESAANGNVAEQTRILFLEEKMKIGPREAMSQQRLDQDKLAGAILQQRSAQDQPQVGVTGTTK